MGYRNPRRKKYLTIEYSHSPSETLNPSRRLSKEVIN